MSYRIATRAQDGARRQCERTFMFACPASRSSGGDATKFASVLPEVRHSGAITVVCVSAASKSVGERYVVCGSVDTTLSVYDRLLSHRQSVLVGHTDQV